MRKQVLVVALCSGVLATVGAGSAAAGEIKGPGSPTGVPVEDATPTPALEHANSICAASGLNHFHEGEPGELPIRTQSYGQLVAAGLKADFPSPGVACNGHTGFFAEG
jgi:hypothetical protein